MSDVATSLRSAPTPRIEYRPYDPNVPLPRDVLGAVAFRDNRLRHNDPRVVRVGLKPLLGEDIIEIWHASGPVKVGFDGIVRYAADADHMLGAIELDERRHGGIAGAAEAAYAALSRVVAGSRHPHLLRIWNYVDGINRGEGDNERYKLFCSGRAAGLRALDHSRDASRDTPREPAQADRFPAATCIGRRDGDPTVQVYWLAGRAPGLPLENPRQVSAYRYPREYGPTPPSFSRAMLASDRLVMISGTASIVGHASRHRGDVLAQLDETFTNLANVLQRAAGAAPGITTRLGPESLLKIYLRDESLLPEVRAFLRERVPSQTQYIVLHADVCRSELLVEIDCLHGKP
ncbi:MAG: pteridine-dependent deoxygenase [Gammaproteobacteria bacterium]